MPIKFSLSALLILITIIHKIVKSENALSAVGPSSRITQHEPEQWNRDLPMFGGPIHNVTIPMGRDAVLACVVENLQTYKVAWLRVDTQTILTIHSHVITKNHRIGVLHSERTSWLLRIRDVRESDRGWYMCQINTDPMKSQVGYLDVVVPPDILDYPTSADMVVREGSNVTLRCAATGSPTPTIVWRREGGELIPLMSQTDGVLSVEGPVFSITRVNRLHMGPYLCIATNGVPPSVSKRVMLIVHFPPMIWIQNQLVGASEGQMLTLECHSEAYPKSINYWTREKGEIIAHGGRFETSLMDNAYKVIMKLIIKDVTASDYGAYKCVAKNSLGDTDGTIKLYHIPKPTTSTTTTTTTTTMATTTQLRPTHDREEIIERISRPDFPDFPNAINEQENDLPEHTVLPLPRERDLRLRGRPHEDDDNHLAEDISSESRNPTLNKCCKNLSQIYHILLSISIVVSHYFNFQISYNLLIFL